MLYTIKNNKCEHLGVVEDGCGFVSHFFFVLKYNAVLSSTNVSVIKGGDKTVAVNPVTTLSLLLFKVLCLI